MGAAWYNVETNIARGYKVWGTASSTNPEGKAIVLALEAAPSGTTINIYTDSLSTYMMLKRISEGGYEDYTTREILKRNCWTTWEGIYTLVHSKKQTIFAHKVTAHSDDKYNDLADQTAKLAARELWDVEIMTNE